MVLRVVILLLILLFTLIACTSGPAPVRDALVNPTLGDPKPSNSADSPQSEDKPTNSPKTASPVIKSDETSVPLNSQLKQQAEQSLQQRRWQQAILFAERGLRINRKEPFFYWVLSTAYQQLADTQQSVNFARQGLRYITDDGWLKTRLMSLAAQ